MRPKDPLFLREPQIYNISTSKNGKKFRFSRKIISFSTVFAKEQRFIEKLRYC